MLYMYNPSTFLIRNIKPLTILCGCAFRFESDLVGNPEQRFARYVVQFDFILNTNSYFLRCSFSCSLMSRVMRKPAFWFPTWSHTNQAVQPQKMARGLKFRIEEVEGLYYMYLCSENKSLMSCAVTAQLICAFVFAYAKNCFFMTRLIFYDVSFQAHLLTSILFLRTRMFTFDRIAAAHAINKI